MSETMAANTPQNMLNARRAMLEKLSADIQNGLATLSRKVSGFDIPKADGVVFEPQVEDRFRDSENAFSGILLNMNAVTTLLLQLISDNSMLLQRQQMIESSLTNLGLSLDGVTQLMQSKLSISDEEVGDAIRSAQQAFLEDFKKQHIAKQAAQPASNGGSPLVK